LEFSIETIGLTKSFGTIKAIDNLNLYVGSNSIHGFLGPNGAGKSTTIKILVGLLRADSGRAKILGADVKRDDPCTRQKVGYLPELPKFPKHLTGQELLEIYGQMYGMSRSQLKTDVPKLLETVGLTGRGKSRIGGYSKGMQQRLGIAQALLSDPELLILDEPSIGLDPVGMVEVRDLIKSIAGHGRTVLLSSHLLYEVEQMCTHVTIMNHGVSRASGPIEEVTKHLSGKTSLEIEIVNMKDSIEEAIRKMPFVSSLTRRDRHLSIQLQTKDDVRTQISQLITSNGGIIVHMAQHGNDLESVFLQLVSRSEEQAK
jgi:ABC-2 type transport system ATP-binding protein